MGVRNFLLEREDKPEKGGLMVDVELWGRVSHRCQEHGGGGEEDGLFKI